MRRAATLAVVMIAALVLASGVALAANRIGTEGPDTLRGTNGSDNLVGKGGRDLLEALGGDDNAVGGEGNDAIFGDGGSDSLVGDGGNDLLVDGNVRESSKDNLVGGDGKDLLDAFNDPAARDIIACGDGFDRVAADREDVVADDCERVAVGRAEVERLFDSIPQSFFDNLPL